MRLIIAAIQIASITRQQRRNSIPLRLEAPCA